MDIRRSQTIENVLADASAPTRAKRGLTTFLAGDSRDLLRQLPDETVDCVITSPPYAEMKDYGAAGQLGFGQISTDAYLADLAKVLAELHRICKAGSALWMVLDTVKTSGKALVLPWEVIERARQAGWNFEDLVIWDKGRSLPWSHVGHFRGVFEYVLLFSKERLRHFSLDQIREVDDLAPYWVKYPERYNPNGKAPSDLWHFPSPVQGSWSKNGIRHHCPFPVGMVARMIALTSRPNDVVLDPFAGTGTVLAVAHYLHRQAIGIDISSKFVRDFELRGFNALVHVARTEVGTGHKRKAVNLSSLIVKLRMLKFPRTLFVELARPDRLGDAARKVIAAFVIVGSDSAKRPSRSDHLGEISIRVLCRRGANLARVRKEIAEVLVVPPLSKFGLKADVEAVSQLQWTGPGYFKRIRGQRWFSYIGGKFHSFAKNVSSAGMPELLHTVAQDEKSRIPPVLSTLKAQVASPVTDYKWRANKLLVDELES